MTTHKQAFNIRTPGQVIAGALSELFTTGALKDWRPDEHLSSLSKVKTPSDWNNLRKLQAKAVGDVADIGLLAAGAGYGIGRLRHAHKVRAAKKQLDEIESSRTEKKSGLIDGAIDLGAGIVSGIAAAMWNTPKWMRDQAAKYKPTNADSANVPLGPLSKGWIVPATLLGAPAAAYMGDRMASRQADTERKRLIAERKARLENEFNQLLTQTSAKRAFADPATAKCASYLDFIEARATKSAMDGTTAALGGIFSFWILSGILAAKAGYDHGKKDDPGKVEQKALKTYEQRSRAGRPTTIRLVHPKNTVPDYQVSDAPYPMAFPAAKQAERSFDTIRTLWENRQHMTSKNVRLVADNIDTITALAPHADKLKGMSKYVTPENIEWAGKHMTPENMKTFSENRHLLTPENMKTFSENRHLLTPENMKTFSENSHLLTPENMEMYKRFAPYAGHIGNAVKWWDSTKDVLRPAWKSIQRGFGNFMQKAKPVLGDVKNWAHRALQPTPPPTQNPVHTPLLEQAGTT